MPPARARGWRPTRAARPGPAWRTRQTVTEFIRSYRFDGILGDLRSPASAGGAISRIAGRWGVHDMPHLTRTFRARYGMSPSEARQRGELSQAGPLGALRRDGHAAGRWTGRPR